MIEVKEIKVPILIDDFNELYDIINSVIIDIGFLLNDKKGVLSERQKMGLDIMLDELHDAREILTEYDSYL